MHEAEQVGRSPLSQKVLARDEDVWRSNLTLLQSRYPEAASLLEQTPRTSKLEAVLSRAGVATLVVRDQEGRAIHLHSAYDPEKEAQGWVEQAVEGDWRIVAVFGLGLGYHVEQLLRRFPDRRIVVVEPDIETVRLALGVRELHALLASPQVELVVAREASEAALVTFRRLSRDLATAPLLLTWPPIQRLHQPFWEVFRQQLLDLTRFHRVNVATYRSFAVQWLVNFFTNLRLSVADPSVAELMEPFASRPAIIVSAGPSLDKNVDLLREAKGHAVIVAAGSAVNPLIRRGIKPDLLVSLDPGSANYRHFENLDGSDLPLVYPPTIFPRIVHEYRGPRWVAGLDTFPFITWAMEKLNRTIPALASGPSVANTAWDLVGKMGCDPVIFVGQDLAYTGLKSHAEGAVHGRTIGDPDGDSRYIYVEDVHGGRVVTDRPMNAMRLWFERKMAQATAGQHYIDATEGGARIAGTEVMSLRRALNRYCQERFDPYEEIMGIHRQEITRLTGRDVDEQLSWFLEELSENLDRVGQIRWQAEKVGRSLLSKATKRTVTARRYGNAHQAFSQLDRDLTAFPVFRTLIRPVLTHVVENVNSVLGKRVEYEHDLTRKSEQLVSTYLSLFNAAARTAAQIQELIRQELADLRCSDAKKWCQ